MKKLSGSLLLLLATSLYAFSEVSSNSVPVKSFKFSSNEWQIELWASSPMLYNPTGMDVDAKGNVWVTESLNYRRFKVANKPNKSFLKGDRVSVLIDSNGDGKADKSHVFVEDKDLIAPLGVAVLDNKIYVSCSPSLFVYTDVNRNMKFDEGDKKDVFLTGFGGEDHDHSLHKMESGPDGRFYINAGNAGPHMVKDKSGWNLRAGSSYKGGSPHNILNTPGLKSDDQRVYSSGVMLSVNEDGTNLKVIGHNFRNPYGHSVDSFGSVWMNDNDDTQSCRTTWLMRYGNLGYTSADGSESWGAGRRPGQSVPTAHWRQDDPGVIPSGHVYGNASPTGMVYYEVGEGMLLSCEAGQNVIWGYERKRKGAGFEMNGFPFLSSTGIQDPNYKWNDLPRDINKWFRPSDIVVGTDGCLYVSDWFDPTVGGHKQNERDGFGSIYRISPKNKDVRLPSYDFENLKGALVALDSPAVNVRYLARKRVLQVGAKALIELKKDFGDSNKFTQARRLWLIAELGDLKFVEDVMKSSSSTDVKIAAYRALELNSPNIMDIASSAIEIEDVSLRREILLSLRDVPFVKCGSQLLQLISYFDGEDRWYLEAIGVAADGKEELVYKEIRKPAMKWDKRTEKLMWRLHPASSVEQLMKRAQSHTLSAAQRKLAIDTLAFIKTEAAATALVDTHSYCDGELGEYCLWWLDNRKRNYWKAYLTDVDLKALNKVKLAFDKLRTDFLKKPDEAALNALLATVKGSKVLLQLTMQGDLPAEIQEMAVIGLLKHNDVEVAGLAKTFHSTKKSQYNIVRTLKLKGDALRGKGLFYGKGICFSCHKVSGKGGEVGPELTAITKKFDQKSLLDAIIDPSSGILVGYESVSLVLNNGKNVEGALLSDKDPLIVRNALGQNVEILKKDIKTQIISKKSIMPEASAIGLSEQDLADLLSYLNNIKK